MKTSTLLLILVFPLSVFPSTSKTFCEPSEEVRKAASQQIFQIVPIRPVMWTMDAEMAKKKYGETCLQTEQLPKHEKLNCELLKKCQLDEALECTRPYANTGSAFLVKDGSVLISAWHVLFHTHSAALNFGFRSFVTRTLEERTDIMLANLSPDFVVVNQHDQIVYDTRENPTRYLALGDVLGPIFSNSGRKGEQSYGYFENSLYDYVVLELSHSLGKGYDLKNRSITKDELEGQCVYGAGYSYNLESEKFEILGGTPSSLGNLHKESKILNEIVLKPLPSSKDIFLALSEEEILRHFGYSESSTKQQIEELGRDTIRDSIETVVSRQQRVMRDFELENESRLLYFDAPIMSEQSGGVLLNDKGEAIGILTNGFIKTADDGGRISKGGLGLLFSGIDFEVIGL